MKEETMKRKITKLNILIFFISFFILAILVLVAYDFVHTISSKEISRAAALKISTAIDEVGGAKGKVIAKYVDLDGNEIAEESIIQGPIGEEYKLERKSIAGYISYGAEPYRKIGNYTSEDVEVIFVYQKESENVDLEQDDHNVTVKVLSEKASSEYNLKIITKDENGNLIKGMTYDVKKGDETIRKGIVQSDIFTVGTLTISEDGLDNYTISEDTGDYYEALTNGNIPFSINKFWNAQKGEFDITLDYNKNLNGVKIEISGNDIIVTITNREIITENGGKVKIFDLDLTKYVSKVEIDNGKSKKEINRTIENKDSILKLEIAPKEISETTIKVTYKVLVENIGEISGYATEITDYIPENFELIEDNNWSLVDGNAISDSLKNELLNPGDKKELEISLVWNLTNENIGVRKNVAQITEKENDENIEDITPENIGEATIIATVKTGAVKVFGLGTLLVLVIVLVVVYIKRNNLKNEE